MNYTELIDAARAYADRNDIEVDANINTFIIMAESRINRALKTAEQTHRVYTATIEGREFYSLPNEYNGMRVVHFNSGEVDVEGSQPVQMKYITPEHLVDYQERGVTDKYYYTILNKQIQVQPTLPEKGTIEMVFYRKVPPLVEAEPNDVNWLSEDAPDIYLSGICAEIELFVKNYEAAAVWKARMLEAIQELSDNDTEQRWTGNSLQIRIDK